MLQIKNVTKIYGKGYGLRALDNVSIDFGSRGLVVVLGKSGCGKSTLLNILGGLDTATYGEVVINGRSTKTFKQKDFDAYRNTFVGIVFQEFNLIDEITVYDNINMTMKLQEKNADVNTVDEALEMVGLSNLGYRKPSELSGGQRQRVALARALLKKPEIILADEPTGALDSVTGEGVFETLKRIAQEKLVIVVTHNRELAFGYADRIIELSDGRVIGDSMKDVETDKSVKELEGRTIEVSAGGKLTKELLNKRLKKDKVNYIGLSYEKDRIALAYPETVEGFYETPSSSKFEKTKDENIPTDNKEFKLSKGKLKFKDSIGYAKAGIKRSKKRYRFLMVVMSVCFTLFSLALMVALVSASSLVAKSAFDSGSQPLVTVGMTGEYGYRTRKMNAEDRELASAIMGSSCAKVNYLSATPNYVNASQYLNHNYESSLDMSYFDGVLEANDFADIGLTMAAGKSKCENENEIIISDFAAYALCRRGYIGYDKDGKYSVLRPATVENVVGTKVFMTETDTAYEVVGIFRTDYERYISAIMNGAYDSEAQKQARIFVANKNYLYLKVLAAEGFTNTFRENRKFGESDERLYVGLYETSNYSYSYYDSLDEVSLKYDKSKTGEILWSSVKDGDNYVAPAALAENEIAVSCDAVRQMMHSYDYSVDIDSPDFRDVVEGSYRLSIRENYYTNEEYVEGVKIVCVYVGAYEENYYKNYGVMVNPTLLGRFFSEETYDALMFGRGASQTVLDGKFSQLEKAAFVYGTAKADYSEVSYFTKLLKDLCFGFLIAAFILLVLAFLTIFSYMSAMIRFRTKEIAVYRVIGAKNTDIMRMFLAEGGFIVLLTSIASIVFSLILSGFLNDVLSGALFMMGVGFTVINFNWFLNPLAIILGSALIVTLSALLPISRITSKKPIEAVKLI